MTQLATDNNDNDKDEEEETIKKEYLRKRLLELSEKSLGEIPQLQEPDEEWIKWRMSGNAGSWEVWDP